MWKRPHVSHFVAMEAGYNTKETVTVSDGCPSLVTPTPLKLWALYKISKFLSHSVS